MKEWIDTTFDQLKRLRHNNGRRVRFDARQPGQWVAVLPERPEPTQSVGSNVSKLFATCLKDVTTRAYVFRLLGKLESEVPMPSPGTAGGFSGPLTTSLSSRSGISA